MEIVVAPNDLACAPKGGGDRVVLDISQQKVGPFTVVVGHPYVSFLGADQAHAEVCPAGDPGNQPPCHSLVRGGRVVITRLDAAVGGTVEGTFHIELADGVVDGTFSAVRCS
jgi:hypothetical protein